MANLILVYLVLFLSAAISLMIFPTTRWVRAATVIATVLHICAALTNHFLTVLPQPDADVYQGQAVAIATGVAPSYFVAGKEGWPILLSYLYNVGGIQIEIGLVLNSLLAASLIPIVYNTAEALRLESGKTAVVLLALMPGWWLWSSTLLREPLIWVLTAVAGLLLVKLRDRGYFLLIPLATVCVAMAWVRAPLSVLIVAGAAVAILVSKGNLAARALMIGALTGSLLVLAGGTLAKVSTLDPSTFGATRDYLANAGSGFDASNRLLTFGRVVTGPWPWDLLHLKPLVLPDVLYLWALGWALFRARKFLRRTDLWLIAPALTVCAGISVIASNYGLLIRLRVMALLLIVPVVAAAYTSWMQSGSGAGRAIDMLPARKPEHPPKRLGDRGPHRSIAGQ